MGQKKIKRSKTNTPTVDPKLEEVGEERAFEIEIDEEEKEVVLVHHYRRKWGDELEGDVEHCMTIEETGELIAALINCVDELQKLEATEKEALLVHKATPTPIENNPMKDNSVQ